jgi:hypothetical protein
MLSGPIDQAVFPEVHLAFRTAELWSDGFTCLESVTEISARFVSSFVSTFTLPSESTPLIPSEALRCPQPMKLSLFSAFCSKLDTNPPS